MYREGAPKNNPEDTWPDGKREKITAVPERLSVESRKLSREIRKIVTEQGLAIMREILRNVSDYVVFASTAMYLHGQAKNIEEFNELPGDFDVAVSKQETLDRIRDLLINVPGIEFDNEGKYRRFPGEDAVILSGIIPIKAGTSDGEKIVEYEFEVFLNSRLIQERVMDQKKFICGFNVLTLEGLRNQVVNSLSFETKVEEASTKIVTFLLERESRIRNELEQWKRDEANFVPSDELIELTHRFRLSPQNLVDFFNEVDDYRALNADENPEVATSSMAKILAGQKTKVKKRLRNLETIKNLT